jgi:hypothetical protein
MRPALLLIVPLSLWSAQTVVTVCDSGCDYANADIQDAIDDAAAANPAPGDEWRIILEAGHTYTSAVGVALRTRTGGGKIYIVSSNLANLPEGVRVTPADAANMPRLEASTGSAIFTNTSANNYVLDGLEIGIPDAQLSRADIVRIGRLDCVGSNNCDNFEEEIPFKITIKRSWIHGNELQDGPTRCIAAHGNDLEITDNYISDCKSYNGDSQAIYASNTKGPMLIKNNFLEGAGENVIFGGGDPYVVGMVPNWIRLIGNHSSKPWHWRFAQGAADPTGTCIYDAATGEQWFNTATEHSWECQAGTWVDLGDVDWPVKESYWGAGYLKVRYHPIIKNSWEYKNCLRCIAHGNLIERNWFAGQSGHIVLYNQVDRGGFGRADNWNSTVSHTDFSYNWVRKSYKGVTVSGLRTPARIDIVTNPPYNIVTGVNDKMLMVLGLGPTTCDVTIPQRNYTSWYDPSIGNDANSLKHAINIALVAACPSVGGDGNNFGAFAGYTGDPFNFTSRYLSGTSGIDVQATANSAYATLGFSVGLYPDVSQDLSYFMPTTGNIISNNIFDEMQRKYYISQATPGSVIWGNPVGFSTTFNSHNTSLIEYDSNSASVGLPSTTNNVIKPYFTGNIIGHGDIGLTTGVGHSGSAAIAIATTAPIFDKNVFINTANWPTGTWNSTYDAGFRALNTITAVQGISSPTTTDNYDIDAAVGFEDYAAKDFRLAAGSPYKNTGPQSRDPGADVEVVQWMTATAESGAVNPYYKLRISDVLVTGSSTATVYYTAHSTETCTVTVDNEATFTSPPFQDTDAGGARSRSMAITGLGANTQYMLRLVCGAASYRAPLFDFSTNP